MNYTQIVKTCSEVMGLKTILKEFGKSVGALALSGASATLGTVQRQGLGKLRHVDCSFLFVQALNAERVIRCKKVVGSMNPADFCTKSVTADRANDHVQTAAGEFWQGRSAACPQLLCIGTGFDRVRLSPPGIGRRGVRNDSYAVACT